MDAQSGANVVGVLLAWGAPVVLLAVVTIRFFQSRKRENRRRATRGGPERPASGMMPMREGGGAGAASSQWIMRRRTRTLRDASRLDRILGSATVCRVALAAGNEPYLVTVSYGVVGSVADRMEWDEELLRFKGNAGWTPMIYFHSAHEGRKMEMIRHNPRVCFEVTGRWKIVPGKEPCGWTARYESVVGYGHVVEVTEEEEKRTGLTAILRQSGAQGPADLPSRALEGAAVLRLSVVELSGKSNWPEGEGDHA